MNEETHNRVSKNYNSKEISQRDVATGTENLETVEDGQIYSRPKYEIFYWFFNYTNMFVSRLFKDLFRSVLHYFYSEHVFPDHITDLMRVQRNLHIENESLFIRQCSRTKNTQFSIRKFFKNLKSYIISSEDDFNLQCSPSKDQISGIDREPIFVIVDSSWISNSSSKVILIDHRANNDTSLTNHLVKNVMSNDIPSTSKDDRKNAITLTDINRTESGDELQMIDINLQSENEIALDDNENDSESIVMSYLRNRDAFIDFDEVLLSSKKKSSLLHNVPKMEIIKEGEQFTPFQIPSKKLSEDSLNIHKQSYPATSESINERHPKFKRAIQFLHEDNDFLVAAEIGNDKLLDILIRKRRNIQQKDYLGRNALHLAVCAGNIQAIVVLLNAGINTNIKDNVGMTPLSLCLMRRPLLTIANLLLDQGAMIVPRSNPMDTGLFLQFVMMCLPTDEEAKILKLLVEKGALVNDPDAPGGRQALHFAAMSNNCELIRILMDLGANMYLTNHRHETPKEVAITFKCRKAQMLLEDLEFKDSEMTSSNNIASNSRETESNDKV